MAGAFSVEIDHCRELALLPGSVFEFTSRYIPVEKQDALLALYALMQAIGSIPQNTSDDAVKLAKLKWWGEELLAEPDAPSRHPVLRALWVSGVREQLANTLLLRLVTDALSQIDTIPDSDEHAMFERHSALGATGILLELALDQGHADDKDLELFGAATSTYRLVSGFAVNRVSAVSLLPLSQLAKFNVSVEQLEQNTNTAELAKIIQQLAETAIRWFSKARSGLDIRSKQAVSPHLNLRWAMEERRLKAIRDDASGFLKAGKVFGPADAWFAWRFVRKMKQS